MLSWQQRVQQAGGRGVPQLLRLLGPDSGQSAQVSGAGAGQCPQVLQAESSYQLCHKRDRFGEAEKGPSEQQPSGDSVIAHDVWVLRL